MGLLDVLVVPMFRCPGTQRSDSSKVVSLEKVEAGGRAVQKDDTIMRSRQTDLKTVVSVADPTTGIYHGVRSTGSRRGLLPIVL